MALLDYSKMRPEPGAFPEFEAQWINWMIEEVRRATPLSGIQYPQDQTVQISTVVESPAITTAARPTPVHQTSTGQYTGASQQPNNGTYGVQRSQTLTMVNNSAALAWHLHPADHRLAADSAQQPSGSTSHLW